VLEHIDKGGSPSINTQRRTTGDRKLLIQTPVGSRDRDRPRLLVDHGRRRLLHWPGADERGCFSIVGREDAEERSAHEVRAVTRVAEDRRAVNDGRPPDATQLVAGGGERELR